MHMQLMKLHDVMDYPVINPNIFVFIYMQLIISPQSQRLHFTFDFISLFEAVFMFYHCPFATNRTPIKLCICYRLSLSSPVCWLP
jgi:hypothetical protein